MFHSRLGRGGQMCAALSPVWLLLVCLFAGAGWCFSQEPPPRQDLTQMSIEDVLNVNVYAASKHLQNVNDAPSSVTIVTADEIQEYGYRTLADILENVRSFYVTSDDAYSYVGGTRLRPLGRLG